MKLAEIIGQTLFSKDTDKRFDKSLKNVEEADRITNAINARLTEIEKQIRSKSVNFS